MTPGRAGCDQDHRMVVPKQPSERMTFLAALEECRSQAQRCIDESAPHPGLRAHWLALAERWVDTAERLRAESDRQS
jgi:hypothetical protein